MLLTARRQRWRSAMGNGDSDTGAMDDTTTTIIVIVGGLVALGLCLWVIAAVFAGAMDLFAYANEQLGFIGIVLYMCCWVFLLPVMLIVCFFAGIMLLWQDRQEKKQLARR